MDYLNMFKTAYSAVSKFTYALNRATENAIAAGFRLGGCDTGNNPPKNLESILETNASDVPNNKFY